MSVAGAVGIASTALPIAATATVLNATRCIGGCGRKAKHMHGEHGCCASSSCHAKINRRHTILGENMAGHEGLVDAGGMW